MEFNYAKQQARRNGRTRIMYTVFVIAILVLLKIFVFKGSILNTFGPYAQFGSSAELNGLYDSQQLYVTTQTDEFFDTDYVLSEDGKDKWYFFAFWAGDQYVICRTPMSYTQLSYTNFTVTGKLAEYSDTYSDLRSRVVGDIASANNISRSEAGEGVSNYIIYLEYNRLGDQIALAVGAVILALMLVYLVKGIRGMVNEGATKSYKQMIKKTGYDPVVMNDQLSREMAEGRVRYKDKTLTVTDNWVGHALATSFAIYPKADIVWIHRAVTQHRTNGIPSGKSHSINLCTVHRQSITVAARNEKDAIRIMDELTRCGFAAIFGFTPAIQQAYANNLDGFIAAARNQAPPQPLAQPVPGPVPGYMPPAPAPAAPPPPPANGQDGGPVNINDYKGPEF